MRVNAQKDYELRSQDGTVKTYKDLRDPDIPGRLIRIEDRNGNHMSFIYEKPGGLSKFALTRVVDTMGRELSYTYYTDGGTTGGSNMRRGRLKQIEDFRRDRNSPSERKIVFDYDPEGNLASVTSPTVQGTPTGNDFPSGKTLRYAYTLEKDLPGSSTAITDVNRQRLLHNMLAVEYPNESAAGGGTPGAPGTSREILTYNADSNHPESFDRVRTYAIGGTNGTGVPAGGTISYQYDIVAPMPETHVATSNDPFLKTTVADRRGNVTEYRHSAYDTLLEKRELTRGFRHNEPDSFITTARYNDDKRLLSAILPEGNTKDHIFDEINSDRFQQGNEIRTVRTADPARGGDQKALFTEVTYEPIYQQPAAVTDSRGLDPGFVPPIPDPRGRSQRERYTTRYFFDYQEGNPVSVLPMLAAKLGTTAAEVQARLTAAGVTLGLGDLNADGDSSARITGNVVRKDELAVALLPGSREATIRGGDLLQAIVTLYRYNRFGQLTSMIDPKGTSTPTLTFPKRILMAMAPPRRRLPMRERLIPPQAAT